MRTGGTHFYRAKSNLFLATREVFAGAFGDEVPAGPAFLHFFAERGAWLVDVADRPVNRLTNGKRSAAVAAGVDNLTSTIRETRPTHLRRQEIDRG